MDRWYVSIDHLSDDQLEFLGYHVVKEDDEFVVYEDYAGEEHVVKKQGPKFIFVEDLNDAAAISSSRAFPAP